MACTKHSAVDYVKNARVLLIKHLKNQSLVVDKLEELEVFNFENGRAVMSEKNPSDRTRKIIDFVINKGEEASYLLLSILHSERGRTLPKDATPDLHQWISCFSFRQEPEMEPTGSKPCQQYQKQLKKRAQAILTNHLGQSKSLIPEYGPFFYAPLVLDTDGQQCPVMAKIKQKNNKYKMARTKKLSTYIPSKEPQKSPEDLLKNGQDILLVGKPGIGKTTITMEMINIWANMENSRLNYLFYFDETTLPDMSKSISLESLLFDKYVEPDSKRAHRADVLQDIKENSEHVIILFDGIKNVPFNSILFKILNKEILPDAKVVLTCRPEHEEVLPEWKAFRVCVQGFNEVALQNYLSHILQDKPDAVTLIMENLELRSLCHVPIHAIMVAACMLDKSAEALKECTATNIYLNIFRHGLMKCNQGLKKPKKLERFIRDSKETILHLCKLGFSAIKQRSILLQDCEDSKIEHTFLNQLTISDGPTYSETHCSFLHNTMQEFFVALWLLANPGEIDSVLLSCTSEDGKHMRHVIHFLCGLLAEKNKKMLKCLIPEEDIKETSHGFHEKLFSTFMQPFTDHGHEDTPDDSREDLIFLCQCLFEMQSHQSCSVFLNKIRCCFQFGDKCLDPYQCCAVSYIIKQSGDSKVVLDLKNCDMSEEIIKLICDCHQHIRVDSGFLLTLWTAALGCGNPELVDMLNVFGNELHLPVWETSVFKTAQQVMCQSPEKINLVLHLDPAGHPQNEAVCNLVLHVLQHLKSARLIQPRFEGISSEEWKQKVMSFHMDLCLQAVLSEGDSALTTVRTLHTLFDMQFSESDFLLDLNSHIRDHKMKAASSLLAALQPLYQSAPAVWSIDLSERKSSILLEVLKLQTQKRSVELRGWSDEESEVRSFLQCLPYISKLRFQEDLYMRDEADPILLNLYASASGYCSDTGNTFPEILLSFYTDYFEYDDEGDCKSKFLLDLCSRVKDIETKSGRILLPALQPLYLSAGPVWTIDLSERKASLLLEVLKLQTQKRPVELRGWSDEESEERSFLQCLPYISQLRFNVDLDDEYDILLHLCTSAAENCSDTGHDFPEVLLSCYTEYFDSDDEEDSCGLFLLGLCSRVKDNESKTGRTVLPALQPLFQSAPAVWSIDLSKRKASLLLEVLKLQTQNRPVELRGWSDEESEVRSFLQCLPYISQLRFDKEKLSKNRNATVQFLVNLSVAAADSVSATGERFSKYLSSVCSYSSFPFWNNGMGCGINSDFLLDLYICLQTCECETARTLFQSAPAFWSIDLSQRKASLLLEVLKLQTQNRPVELRGWSDEESDVRSFLQCLPYISQLRFSTEKLSKNPNAAVQFLVNLSLAAADSVSARGESFSEIFSSVCSYSSFPFSWEYNSQQTDVLLDLYSYVMASESGHGRAVLSAFLPIYQSAPQVWSIDLSERKASLLLEVLKLQTQKRPVELQGWSDEEGEVRSFLQCLPFMSKLRVSQERLNKNPTETFKFLVDLSVAAAECVSATGESFSELFSSVCSYRSFPFGREDNYKQSDMLLDLYSYVMVSESKHGHSLPVACLPIYQSAPAVWSIDLSKRKASLLLEVLKLQTQKRPVELRGWSDEESEVRCFLQCLPYISQLRISQERLSKEPNELSKAILNLSVAAADAECLNYSTTTGERFSELLSRVCSYSSFPFSWEYNSKQTDVLLDLYSYVMASESGHGRAVLSAFLPIYQSAPQVWSIDLSERKASLLLEVLKLQTQKRPVELRGWPDEESEVMSFFQCLPHITQLRVEDYLDDEPLEILLDLYASAAGYFSDTGDDFPEVLLSCYTEYFGSDDEDTSNNGPFLLDLCSRVKDNETKTGRTLLPALQPLFESAPAVWSIDLSKRKASLLLEVLKLQTQHTEVELTGWSDEESELRSFLQCLHYISKTRFDEKKLSMDRNAAVQFLVNLSLAAADSVSATGERISKTLSNFRIDYDIHSDFLIDLYILLQTCECEKVRKLQSVYKSATAVWSIDLSKRKASLLLKVLKLQTQKRPVELRGWSDEESEMRSFLQCLPYISQLRFGTEKLSKNPNAAVQFLVNLSLAAADSVSARGERFSEIFSSVCSYSSFPFSWEYNSQQTDVLLDLYSYVMASESGHGRAVLSAFLPIYQSAPQVWSIDLSARKASLLLEVLKLQTQKRPVELRGWSDEEGEVRSFLQCLPFMSKLRVSQERLNENPNKTFKFLVDLSVAAAECVSATGESFSELFSSVCSYRSFPFGREDNYKQSDMLLDLYSYVMASESKHGHSLPVAFLPIYHSAPAVWSIDLSERKASLLLEVLKLLTQKRPVELRGWSDEESEVRSFLICLLYISQLSFNSCLHLRAAIKFLVDLSVVAADSECVSATGESLSKIFSSVYLHCYTLAFGALNSTKQSDFLLELFSCVKHHEPESVRSLLLTFLPVYKSATAVWSIDLSKRRASILLEVLKLRTQKRPVELRGWPDEESDMMSFCQCLPYISQLRFDGKFKNNLSVVEFLVDLSVAAADSGCVSATGESFSELFSSMCSYSTFPFERRDNSAQSDLLLDLYSHVMDYESKHDRSLLSAFLPIYQLSPVVWSIDVSKRKASTCLEVLKLQTQKRPVELRGWSDDKGEVRKFLQCLPYISQLRLNFHINLYSSKAFKFLVDLSVAAADSECVSSTAESFSELFSSVCSYSSFPFGREDNSKQSDILLDLYSYVKSTDRSLFPAFLPIYQSGPKIWYIDLFIKKTSIFLEVLKFQTQKRPVELRGWSDEESEVRSFLQCLPYISKLSFYEGYNPHSALLDCVSVGSQQELLQLFQTLNYTLCLEKDLPSSKCKSVGRALGWIGAKLDLTLTPDHISLRGVKLMFRRVRCLYNLRLNDTMVMRLARALRTGQCAPITVENLSLEINSARRSPRALSRVLSCLSLLLRLWTVHCLDLSSCNFESHSLIMLLSLQCPFKLRLRTKKIQKLVLLVSEVEDKEITESFLVKVGGDLSSCTLTNEVLLSLLQHSSATVTVDYRKCEIREQNTLELLTQLDRIRFQRPTTGFIMSIIREIYQTHSPYYVSSLLRSTENCLNLNTRVLDAADFTALHYILQHSQGVKLNLMWTSTPEGALESIVLLLSNVSQLSVDRQQLLGILNCCASSDDLQGASLALLQALQHSLDFSCSSAMDLTDDTQGVPMMHLRAEDCRVIATVMGVNNTTKTWLTLLDCHVEEAGLEHLFWVLDKATLRCSNLQLLQFLALLSAGSEGECVRRAKCLRLAVGEEVDLSHTVLDQRACGTLARLLEYSEGLSELDLSHCQLTDHCLEPLLPHLHKTTALDLSDNNITDIGAQQIKSVVNTTSSILTVRLFNNNIERKHLYQGDKRFELW